MANQQTPTNPKEDKYVGELREGKRHGQGTMSYALEAENKKDPDKSSDHLSHLQPIVGWEPDLGPYYDDQNPSARDYWLTDYTEGGLNRILPRSFAERRGLVAARYVGEWKNDNRHGHGTYTDVYDGEYVGGWKDGKKHGQGTYNYASEDEYVGEWRDDKFTGKAL